MHQVIPTNNGAVYKDDGSFLCYVRHSKKQESFLGYQDPFSTETSNSSFNNVSTIHYNTPIQVQGVYGEYRDPYALETRGLLRSEQEA